MRPIRPAVVMVVATLFSSIAAFAALDTKYVEWGSGPVKWIMTPDEQDEWARIETNEAAKAFIELFWARRDPTPDTPANEFKKQFDGRVKFADEEYSWAKTKGSMTDRGRVLIVLGGPWRVETSKPSLGVNKPKSARALQAAASSGTAGGAPSFIPMDNSTIDAARGTELWYYDASRTKAPLGQPQVLVSFLDHKGSGEWKLERNDRVADYKVIFDRVNISYVLHPHLTVAPTFATTTTTVIRQASSAPLKTEALLAAVAELKSGPSPLSRNTGVAFAELLTPSGEYYVPVQLFIDRTAGMNTSSADTFFGVIEDTVGNVVTSFEEKAKLLDSNGDVVADKTLHLGTGKYTATLGLAKGGRPVAIASRSLDLRKKEKNVSGTSNLILWNQMLETPEAAPVKAPFAFGKLKLIPKGNLRFAAKDDLGYFVEVHNPGIDSATNSPKLHVKIELEGKGGTISAPLQEATAVPLSGSPGPGQYAIISSIPLGEMPEPLAPGAYVLKVRLIDTITQQSYDIQQSFDISG